MPDSWEFAIREAHGRYITYLCDDDALVPRLLPTLATMIQQTNTSVVTWAAANYHHPNWREPALRNSAQVPLLSGQAIELGARAALRQLFDEIWPTFPVPKMLQSACSAELIQSVRAANSRFFMPSCPDLSTAVCLLSQVDRYVHLDDALMLSGAAQESIGANQWYGRDAISRLLQEFKQGEIFNFVPLGAQVGINFVADTLLRAKAAVPADIDDVNLNWTRYFVGCYEGLMVFRKQGIEVTAELDEFWQVLRRQPPHVQQEVRVALSVGRPNRVRRQLRRLINSSAWLRSLEHRLRPSLRGTTSITLSGSVHGFSNIAECAAMLDEVAQRQSHLAECA